MRSLRPVRFTGEGRYRTAIQSKYFGTIFGVPILPIGHSVKDVGNNKQTAQAVNQWIRNHDKRQGAAEPSFDAVIDVEAAVKDASDPAWSLRSDLTCDHVHPNQAGYQAIAAAIPLALFTPVTAVPAAQLTNAKRDEQSWSIRFTGTASEARPETPRDYFRWSFLTQCFGGFDPRRAQRRHQ